MTALKSSLPCLLARYLWMTGLKLSLGHEMKLKWPFNNFLNEIVKQIFAVGALLSRHRQDVLWQK